ncbi:MAG: LysM domain-containing protein [Rhodocyclaceae bacterium]
MTDLADSRTGFEKWRDGLARARDDDTWDAWDCEIRAVVNEYNRHLATTPGFMPLDWHVIKAMIWVESGPHKEAWASNPMQIGVSADPGLGAFLSGNEGGDLILPIAWKGVVTETSARAIPSHSLRAGVGYLLMRMANYAHRSIFDPDPRIYHIAVKAGDSLDRIARTHGSTTEALQQLNPGATTLRPGQMIKLRKARVRRVITGWHALTPSRIAIRYNSMRRDPTYIEKLTYALDLVFFRKEARCAQ